MPDAKTLATRYVELRGGPSGLLVEDVRRSSSKAGDEGGRALSSTFQKHANGIGSRLRSTLTSSVGAAIAGVGIGAAVVKVFSTGVQEVEQYQAGLAQLRAGLKSTGNVAGITAPQMENLASSIQSYSGQTDDSIVKTESLLLTFTNIKDVAGKNNDVFTQTTKIAADMAARMGGDASGAAIQLGKALNDPVKGITALTRVGVSFDDGQKKQIATMVRAGDTLGAQKIILGELNKEFGGSAKAAGQTLPGQIARLKRSFEDLAQNIITKVAPTLLKVATFITNTLIPGMGKLYRDVVPKVRQVFAVMADLFTTKVLPVVSKVAGFLGGALHSAIKSVSGAINDNRPFLTALVHDLQVLGEFIATKVAPVLVGVLGVAIRETGVILGNLIRVIARVYTTIRDLIAFVSDVFHGRWGKAWNDIKGVATNAVGAVVQAFKGLPLQMLHALGDLAGMLARKGAEVGKGLLRGIGESVIDAVRYMGSLPGRLLHGLGNVATLLWDAGVQIIKGLAKGIEDEAKHLPGQMAHIGKDLIEAPFKAVAGIFSPSRVFHGHGRNIVQGLINGLNSMSPALRKTMTTMASSMSAQIATVAGNRSTLASSVTSGLLGSTDLSSLTVGGDGASAPTFTDVKGLLSGGLSSLVGEKTGLNALIKGGLDKRLVQQLGALSPGQADPLIAAIRSGGASGIKQLNGLERGIGNTATLIGQSVGTQAYGKQQAEMVSSLHRIENLLASAPAKTAGGINGVGKSAVIKGKGATKPVKRTGIK